MTKSFAEIARFTDEQAREHLESVLWPNGPVCPHCKSGKATRIPANPEAKVRPGLYRCDDCGKQFTATVGTIFADSHIPLRTWLMAFSLMCSSKKGVSALQLKRQLGLGSYKSAWFMCHRIRFAMTQDATAMLKGIVESDETYCGGRSHGKRGRPGKQSNKTPVVALVERGGEARMHVTADVTAATLRSVLWENIDPTARLMTDQFNAYTNVGKRFVSHETVNHGEGEYARGDVHCNGCESIFSLLKRSIVGAFHNVSRQHLGRYTTEVEFRWNRRKMSDAERTADAIRGAEGKRLTYSNSGRGN